MIKSHFSLGCFIAVITSVLPQSVYSSNHLMQIEQVIGGVNGDITAQAIQLRMRSLNQNFIIGTQLKVYDATGSNPITLISFNRNVIGGSCSSNPMNSRILISSENFTIHTDPPVTADFTFTNMIPESYLTAGSLTFESNSGIVWWRVSWGGAEYTGDTSGSMINDSDGEFGPPFLGPLPFKTSRALEYQGPSCAQSTTNEADYDLTTSAGVFVNNVGESFAVISVGACCFTGQSDCSIFSESICMDFSGNYEGNATLCEPNPCFVCSIQSGDPPDCSIDARYPHDPDDKSNILGRGIVIVNFDCSPDILESESFSVTPPGVTSVIEIIPTIKLHSFGLRLSQPIVSGDWTCIEHTISQSMICLGSLPGDVNGDSLSNENDVKSLIEHIHGLIIPPLNQWQCDIDRSGDCKPMDILAVIDLLNGASMFDAWFGTQFTRSCPSISP